MTDWGVTTSGAQDPWGAAPTGDFGKTQPDTGNQWNEGGGGSSFDQAADPGLSACNGCGGNGHGMGNCPNTDQGQVGNGEDDKCFGCGEAGHRRSECPTAEPLACRYCKQPGHMVKDCPDKPPMICGNCGEEGHMRRNCENARKVNRDHIADVSADDAWNKIKQAALERDMDDAKEAVQEYIKALGGAISYKELQQGLMDDNIGLWLIAIERSLINIFTNMDLQGNTGKKYSISFRFSDRPSRPREAAGWPESREEILARLDDAGEVVNSGLPKCHNCGEVGHISKSCPEERVERTDAPKISCYNCGGDGHRVRDCPEPRIDKFACKNCGKSGHKAAECEEPPNADNVECRRCSEKGHFAKDCPQGGGRACRNCGEEGHMAKDCDQPRNMDTVTCRNCEKTGHFSRECPEPKDWSKVQCSVCEEFGHTRVRCKKAPAEPQGDDGGSYPADGGFDNANDFATGPDSTSGGWGKGGTGATAATPDANGWDSAPAAAPVSQGAW